MACEGFAMRAHTHNKHTHTTHTHPHTHTSTHPFMYAHARAFSLLNVFFCSGCMGDVLGCGGALLIHFILKYAEMYCDDVRIISPLLLTLR